MNSASPSRKAPDCTLVIFGAGGDLTKRLVVPALYNLACAGRLPENFKIIGVDIADLATETWRKSLSDMMQSFVASSSGEFHPDALDQAKWDGLTGCMTYQRGDFSSEDTFKQLGGELSGNVLFYLAVADRFFQTIIERLGAAGLAKAPEGAWRRVIIEKPFGHDLASAQALNAAILKVLAEDQIYRIDHFLGKETVQNIMVLRFANGIYEPLWSRDHIDHVEITASETVGVERRGKFYERTGALRDMMPNHLFQLLAMVAMEPPSSFEADAVRGKKTELFAAIRPIPPEDAVRGQYDAGTVLGHPAKTYRSEPDVDPQSQTETYVALKLSIDNWRWAGVPFYLRTGKYMSTRKTEIAIQFRQAPYALFRDTPVEKLPPNVLTLRIQPDEGLSVSFSAKAPGPDVTVRGVAMNFNYRDYFGTESEVGYETLIYDCMIGDATLFQRADTVEAAWRAVDPVLRGWAADAQADFPNYAAGSAGPAAADALLARDGHAWQPLEHKDLKEAKPS